MIKRPLILTSTAQALAYSRSIDKQINQLGFVPTMGSLHRGHLSLVRHCKELCSKVTVSIFVNPTQFNDIKDFELYPVNLERDLELLSELEVDAVFIPKKEDIYRAERLEQEQQKHEQQTWVEVTKLSEGLCGKSRPGHFRGVTTVLAKLFNIISPDMAVFGEKDFQQLRLVECMVQELNFQLKIVRGATEREDDGLAMSSRNVRLSPESRALAPKLYQSLLLIRESYLSGQRQVEELSKKAKDWLANFPAIKLDYLSIASEHDLVQHAEVKPKSRVFIAAYIEGVRLIDNLAL